MIISRVQSPKDQDLLISFCPSQEPEEKKHHKSRSKKSKETEKPNISYPTKFTHVVHVGFDDHTGKFVINIFSESLGIFLSLVVLY